jgi:hypothetical protein
MDGAQGRNLHSFIHGGFQGFCDYTLLLTLLKADSIPPLHAFGGAVLYMTPGSHSARYSNDSCLLNT